jgi:hypothetical protein
MLLLKPKNDEPDSPERDIEALKVEVDELQGFNKKASRL